jgi:hypothetical protein
VTEPYFSYFKFKSKLTYIVVNVIPQSLHLSSLLPDDDEDDMKHYDVAFIE